MVNIFLSFVVTGTVGAVLALVIYLTKNIIRKHFPSNWLYYMWAAVLIITVLPLRLEIPNVADSGLKAGNDHAPGEVVFVVSEPKYVGETDFPDNASTAYESSDADIAKKNKEENHSITDTLRIISYIWLICAVLLFFYKVISYIVFYISVMKDSTKTDIPEIRKYTGRKIRTRICPALSSPLMTGILFPVLFLRIRTFPEKGWNMFSHMKLHILSVLTFF